MSPSRLLNRRMGYVVGCVWTWTIVCLAVSRSGFAQDSAKSLRELAEPFFSIGAGIGAGTPERPQDRQLLTHQFNTVTAENCMKMSPLRRREGVFRFEVADRFVRFAVDNKLQVVGHCLVWATDKRTPEWIFRDGEEVASSELLLSRLQTHIETVVSRYRSEVSSWDVVNEALADGSGENYLRDSGWSRVTGEEFLVKAFEFARAADPDAVLIYNDYGCESPRKRAHLVRLVKMLKERNAPIDAVGIQGHYELDAVPYEGLEETLQAVRSLGLRAVISELDIDVVKRGRWWADGGRHREELATYNPYQDGCPPEVLQRQAEQYARLFKLLVKYSDVIDRVSFWNLHDGHSWLNTFPWRRVNHPLLFDRERQPKPAWVEVVKVLETATEERRRGTN